MAISYIEAEVLLKSRSDWTPGELLDLVRQVNVQTHGTQTISYNGGYIEGTRAAEIARALKVDSRFRVLDNTDGFTLLKVKTIDGQVVSPFRDAAIQAFGGGEKGKESFNLWTRDGGTFRWTDPTGKVVELEKPWPNISKRFVAEGEGDLLVLALDGSQNKNGVLFLDEIPAALESGKYQNIAGFNVDQLSKMRTVGLNTGMTEEAILADMQRIVTLGATNQADLIGVLKADVMENGQLVSKVVGVDTSALTGIHPVEPIPAGKAPLLNEAQFAELTDIYGRYSKANAGQSPESTVNRNSIDGWLS